jgi:hypothetical protein
MFLNIYIDMWYMLSINETYVFMKFDLVVVQVYNDLYLVLSFT